MKWTSSSFWEEFYNLGIVGRETEQELGRMLGVFMTSLSPEKGWQRFLNSPSIVTYPVSVS